MMTTLHKNLNGGRLLLAQHRALLGAEELVESRIASECDWRSGRK